MNEELKFHLQYQKYYDLEHDEEMIESAMRMLMENNKIPLDINQIGYKNIEKAYALMRRASDNSLPWQSRLERITQAIMYAPKNANILTIAYTDRSEILFNIGLYEECLYDIDRALITCPVHIKPALYTRKAKALLTLKNEMSSVVQQVVNDARNSIANPSFGNENHFNRLLNELSTKPLLSKPYNKTDYGKIVTEIPKDIHSTIKQASSIGIRYSRKFGRFIIATRDIEAGKTVLVHKTFASILNAELRHKYCWYCSKRTWAGIPCHQCSNVIYCNNTCRTAAWKEYHDIECGILFEMIERNMSVNDIMVMRLTIKAYNQNGSQKAIREKLRIVDKVIDPVSKCVKDVMFNVEDYVNVYTLSRGHSIYNEDLIKAVHLLRLLAATVDVFTNDTDTFEELIEDPDVIYIGALMFRHYGICRVNSIKTFIYNDDGKKIERGISVNPLISVFNHSCDPNACHYVSGDTSVITTIQRIKKHEQVFLNYIPPFWQQLPDERISKLLNDYKFRCDCIACINNWGPNTFNIAKYEVEEWVIKDIAHIQSILSSILILMNNHENVEYPMPNIMRDYKQRLHALYSALSH